MVQYVQLSVAVATPHGDYGGQITADSIKRALITGFAELSTYPAKVVHSIFFKLLNAFEVRATVQS